MGRISSPYIGGQTATRITFESVQVAKDTLKIFSTPDGLEPAPLEHVSALPEC